MLPIQAQELLTACDMDGNGVVDQVDFMKVMQAAWDQPQELWQDMGWEPFTDGSSERLEACISGGPYGSLPTYFTPSS